MKSTKESINFLRYIAEFLNDYAPNVLTNSKHTLKSYKDALILYVLFLESEGITPTKFTAVYFEKLYIEKWIRWLKDIRKSCPDTCNVRLASIRVFLEYVGSKDVSLLYLNQEARLIKRQKCVQKKLMD